jgi:hypothetical protein
MPGDQVLTLSNHERQVHIVRGHRAAERLPAPPISADRRRQAPMHRRDVASHQPLERTSGLAESARGVLPKIACQAPDARRPWPGANRYGITLNRAWTERVAEHGVSETIAVARYLMEKKIWPSPATLGCNSNVTVLLMLLQKPLHGMYFAAPTKGLRRSPPPRRASSPLLGGVFWFPELVGSAYGCGGCPSPSDFSR